MRTEPRACEHRRDDRILKILIGWLERVFQGGIAVYQLLAIDDLDHSMQKCSIAEIDSVANCDRTMQIVPTHFLMIWRAGLLPG